MAKKDDKAPAKPAQLSDPRAVTALRGRLRHDLRTKHGLTWEQAQAEEKRLGDDDVADALKAAAAEDHAADHLDKAGPKPAGFAGLSWVTQIVQSPVGGRASQHLCGLLGHPTAGAGGIDRAHVGSEHGGLAPHGQGTVDPATGLTTTPGGQEPGNPGPDADPTRA